jgi:hypothetical protein
MPLGGYATKVPKKRKHEELLLGWVVNKYDNLKYYEYALLK